MNFLIISLVFALPVKFQKNVLSRAYFLILCNNFILTGNGRTLNFLLHSVPDVVHPPMPGKKILIILYVLKIWLSKSIKPNADDLRIYICHDRVGVRILKWSTTKSQWLTDLQKNKKVQSFKCNSVFRVSFSTLNSIS